VRTDLFDFELPGHRIALEPASPRDGARMLVIEDYARTDRFIRDLPDLLQPGDALVVNDTRVIPAALEGVRTRNANTARIAFNLIKRIDDSHWRAFARPAKRLIVSDTIAFIAPGASPAEASAGPNATASVTATITGKGDSGEVTLSFDRSGSELDAAIATIGETPLPPYIALKRPARAGDRATYQTVYAERDGAVAAPTAGLHFTPELLERLAARGITRHTVTLHVGAGTFLPVKAEDTSAHKMHSEWIEIDQATADELTAVRARGGRIVAVGTTSLRVLESATTPGGTIRAMTGETAIFITPGYPFRAVDVLLTNFHLPRSTLFMLVSAFAGLDAMKAAYAHAIASGYRFYSYGDACLLLRAP
jgi:S-adenosylmethionine:tRNA ribosyltransferase-isomerase